MSGSPDGQPYFIKFRVMSASPDGPSYFYKTEKKMQFTVCAWSTIVFQYKIQLLKLSRPSPHFSVWVSPRIHVVNIMSLFFFAFLLHFCNFGFLLDHKLCTIIKLETALLFFVIL